MDRPDATADALERALQAASGGRVRGRGDRGRPRDDGVVERGRMGSICSRRSCPSWRGRGPREDLPPRSRSGVLGVHHGSLGRAPARRRPRGDFLGRGASPQEQPAVSRCSPERGSATSRWTSISARSRTDEHVRASPRARSFPCSILCEVEHKAKGRASDALLAGFRMPDRDPSRTISDAQRLEQGHAATRWSPWCAR